MKSTFELLYVLNQKEFKNLFEMHFAQVRNFVFYRSGDTDVATDIAQETFIKVWEKRSSIQSEKVKGFLFKVANDLFISHYRKEKRSFEFFNHYIFDQKGETPEEILAFEQLKGKYEKALEVMHENQRTVFLLSRIENYKYSEIAEMLGLSVKAVEKRMSGALKLLRKYLK